MEENLAYINRLPLCRKKPALKRPDIKLDYYTTTTKVTFPTLGIDARWVCRNFLDLTLEMTERILHSLLPFLKWSLNLDKNSKTPMLQCSNFTKCISWNTRAVNSFSWDDFRVISTCVWSFRNMKKFDWIRTLLFGNFQWNFQPQPEKTANNKEFEKIEYKYLCYADFAWPVRYSNLYNTSKRTMHLNVPVAIFHQLYSNESAH